MRYIVAIIIFVVSLPASAGTRLYAGGGYDFSMKSAPECRESNWKGRFGFEHDLYSFQFYGTTVRIEAAYRHTSCLDETNDLQSSETVGTSVVWHLSD